MLRNFWLVEFLSPKKCTCRGATRKAWRKNLSLSEFRHRFYHREWMRKRSDVYVDDLLLVSYWKVLLWRKIKVVQIFPTQERENALTNGSGAVKLLNIDVQTFNQLLQKTLSWVWTFVIRYWAICIQFLKLNDKNLFLKLFRNQINFPKKTCYKFWISPLNIFHRNSSTEK